MTLTLDGNQESLSKRGHIAMFPLVVLETFSDRDARTVASTYYWTRGAALRYEWDDVTAVDFQPVIRDLAAIERRINHLPDASDYTTREAFDLVVDASPQAGTYLWKTLLAENLIGARVTVGSLLVDPGDFTSPDWFDLSAWGRRHVVRWRGEVTAVPDILDGGQAFRLQCESEEVKLVATRVVAGYPDAPASSVGVPYPVPIGTRIVQAIPINTGIVGSLRADITTVTTTVDVWIDEAAWDDDMYTVDGAGTYDQDFAGRLHIGGETVEYDASAVQTGEGWIRFTGVEARTSSYSTGEVVTIPAFQKRYAIAGNPVSDIGEVYLTTTERTNQRMDRAAPLVGASNKHVYLVNDETGGDGGPVAFVEITDNAPTPWYEAVDPDRTRVDVEVRGTAVIGTSSTTFIDVTPYNSGGAKVTPWPVNGSQEGTSQEGKSANLTDIAGECSMGTLTADDATIDCDTDCYVSGVRTIPTPTGTLTYPAVLEWVVDIPAATLAKTRTLEFGVRSGDDLTYQSRPLAYRTYRPDELVAGENTLRLYVADADRTESTEMGDVFVHIKHTEDATGETWKVVGDVLRYEVTTEEPSGAHPITVIEQAIDDFLPTAAVTYDTTTFNAAETNTPDGALSFNLADYPTLGELLAAVGFNSRINFVLTETNSGTVVKAYTPTSAYAWGAATRELGSEYSDLRLTFRNLGDIANRFVALYDLGFTEDAGLYSSYQKTLVANETVNDISAKVTTATITASQADFGKRDSIDIPFTMISDDDAAIDVLGYYATESMRGQVQRLTCVVPFALGYDLEPGDIVSILPPWESSALKVRVLAVVFSWDQNGVGLVLEELP